MPCSATPYVIQYIVFKRSVTVEVLYLDNKIIVCVKPAGVLSTDEPGGMPSLLRAALGDDTAPVYTCLLYTSPSPRD